MAITGIDTIEGKQIIAAGATSAKYAGAAKSGNTEFSLAQVANTVTTHSAQWDEDRQGIPYTATADSAFKTNSAIETNAIISPPGTSLGQYVTAGLTPSGVIVKQNQVGMGNSYFTASTDGATIILSSKWGNNTPRGRVISTTQDNVYSGDVWIVDVVDAAKTVKDNSASWGGGSTYTGNVQEALDEVYTNSSDWNESYDTLTANSASWSTTYTGNVQEALDKVYTDSSTWDNVTAKQDKLTFNYDGSDNITGINSSAIGGVGSTYTGNVQEALDEVYTNSGNWNESYDTLTANSASWGGGGASYTGNVQEALDKVYTDSANWDNVSAKQDKLTFNYDGSNNITGINSSAIGGSQVVTATGGTNNYVQTINETPIYADAAASASFAYYASNGVFLSSISNSASSGYAASAYLKNSVTGNVANWNAASNLVTTNSGSFIITSQNYDSTSNPNFWQYAGNNIYGLKINSGNFNQLTVSHAALRATKSLDGVYNLNLYFRFSKFVPKTATATYTTVQSQFIQFYNSNLHVIDPFTAMVCNDYGTTFGCLNYNGLYGDGIDLKVWSPWTGYTGQEMYFTASFHIR